MNRRLFTAAIAGALAAVGAAQAAGAPAAGKNDAQSCAICHGLSGQGTQIAPRIAGMQPAAFVRALQDFKSGRKDNAMMKAQASNLSQQQMEDLAAYFSSLR